MSILALRYAFFLKKNAAWRFSLVFFVVRCIHTVLTRWNTHTHTHHTHTHHTHTHPHTTRTHHTHHNHTHTHNPHTTHTHTHHNTHTPQPTHHTHTYTDTTTHTPHTPHTHTVINNSLLSRCWLILCLNICGILSCLCFRYTYLVYISNLTLSVDCQEKAVFAHRFKDLARILLRNLNEPPLLAIVTIPFMVWWLIGCTNVESIPCVGDVVRGSLSLLHASF